MVRREGSERCIGDGYKDGSGSHGDGNYTEGAGTKSVDRESTDGLYYEPAFHDTTAESKRPTDGNADRGVERRKSISAANIETEKFSASGMFLRFFIRVAFYIRWHLKGSSYVRRHCRFATRKSNGQSLK